MKPSLRAFALRWVAWAALSRFGQEAFRLAGRLVLARLLWPEAFGLFTLAATVVAGVQLCCQLQLDASLVQRRDLGDDLRATAFWSLAGLGLVGTVVVLLIAGPGASLLGQPAVAPLIRVMSLQILLTGLALTPRALLWRDLNFRGLAAAGLLSEAVANLVAIAAVLAGAGVMSLVVHAILLDLVDVVVMWRMVRWRPRLHWRRAEFLELARFGAPLAGRRAIELGGILGERFVVGLAFGPTVLGLYTLALRLVRAIGDGVASVFSRVSFAAFARTRDDEARSRRGLLAAFRYAAIIVVPLVCGLALMANDVVSVLLGGKWRGTVPFLQILALRAAFASLAFVPRSVLQAYGRQWRLVGLSVGGLVALALFWTMGLPWGPLGVAAGSGLAAATLVPIVLWMASAEIRVRPMQWLRALLPAAVATAAMAAGVEAAQWLLSQLPPVGGVARLGAIVAAGGACYAAAIAPWVLREARYVLPSMRSRQEPTGSARLGRDDIEP